MDPITLHGSRLILRPWRAADLEPLFAINGDPDSMRYFPAAMTRTESDAWAERLQTHFEAHGWGFWAVEERNGAPFLGVVGLMHIPWEAPFTPAVEIGWRISPGFRGRGFATEAARLALDFGFGEAGLREIVAFTVPGNVASWRLMERLGMRRDATFDHPRLPEGHALRRHLLYRISAPA